MNYRNIINGIFLSRPNRFIAHVKIEEQSDKNTIVICHVKNTGRCKELLIPGVSVILEYHPDAERTSRKTSYSLIGVYKQFDQHKILVNIDSQVPNLAAYEWLSGKTANQFSNQAGGQIVDIRREVTYGQSRFDLAFKVKHVNHFINAFMEVKGVTLEENGIAIFPDAPTKRGVKHITELIHASQNGYEAFILFVIQMKGITEFTPNWKTDPEFGNALQKAKTSGVQILAYDCLVTEDGLSIDKPVPVIL